MIKPKSSAAYFAFTCLRKYKKETPFSKKKSTDGVTLNLEERMVAFEIEQCLSPQNTFFSNIFQTYFQDISHIVFFLQIMLFRNLHKMVWQAYHGRIIEIGIGIIWIAIKLSKVHIKVHFTKVYSIKGVDINISLVFGQ